MVSDHVMNRLASGTWVALICVACALCVAVVFGFSSPSMTYLNPGEWLTFTWLTTHFSHSSLPHLFGNLSAMVLLALTYRYRWRAVVLTGLLTIVAVSCFVWTQNLAGHLGLSALNYGWLGLIAVMAWKAKDVWVALSLGIAICFYLIYCTFYSPETFVVAHVIGLFCGLVVGWRSVQMATIYKASHCHVSREGK